MEEHTKVEPEVKEEVKEPVPEKKAEKKAEPEVDVQALMTELAKAKRDRDKASSEAAEYKRQWKASMSEVEKASMEKAEKEAAREEEYQRLLRENTINRIEKSYLTMGWSADEAEKMATAEADGDFDAKVKIMAQVQERQKKDMEKSFLATYGDVNIGGGSGVSYTKEQFDSMGMIERTKLKRENEAEYNRLLALK